MNALISIIIPVKNGSKYIEEALNGIIAQKMNVEIIVVDDASTDNTVKIAQGYGCKIVKHEISKGQIAGKNSGIKAAEGEYILFHDHDDIMTEGALQRLYSELSADNSVSAVQAKVQDFYSRELSEDEIRNTQIKKEPYWGLFTGAILIRKNVFDKIGLFDESIRAGEIIEWKSKMDSNGLKIKKIDFVSTMRRIHTTNFGRTDRQEEFKNYAAILRAKLKNI